MIAEAVGNSLRCPHCHSTDAGSFRLERKVSWREPIREMFADCGRLVLVAECDTPLVDMTASRDELLCLACGQRSILDVTVFVHHEDPKS